MTGPSSARTSVSPRQVGSPRTASHNYITLLITLICIIEVIPVYASQYDDITPFKVSPELGARVDANTVTFTLEHDRESVSLGSQAITEATPPGDILSALRSSAQAGTGYEAVFLVDAQDQVFKATAVTSTGSNTLAVTFGAEASPLSAGEYRLFLSRKDWTFTPPLPHRYPHIRLDDSKTLLSAGLVYINMPSVKNEYCTVEQLPPPTCKAPVAPPIPTADKAELVLTRNGGIYDIVGKVVHVGGWTGSRSVTIHEVMGDASATYPVLKLRHPLTVTVGRDTPRVTVPLIDDKSTVHDAWEVTFGGLGTAPTPEIPWVAADKAHVAWYFGGLELNAFTVEANPPLPPLPVTLEQLEMNPTAEYTFTSVRNAQPPVVIRWALPAGVTSGTRIWMTKSSEVGNSGRVCNRCQSKSIACPGCTWSVSQMHQDLTSPYHVYRMQVPFANQTVFSLNVTMSIAGSSVDTDLSHADLNEHIPVTLSGGISASLASQTLLESNALGGAALLVKMGHTNPVQQTDSFKYVPFSNLGVECDDVGVGLGLYQSSTCSDKSPSGSCVCGHAQMWSSPAIPFGQYLQPAQVEMAADTESIDLVFSQPHSEVDIVLSDAKLMQWQEPYLFLTEAQWLAKADVDSTTIASVKVPDINGRAATLISRITNTGPVDGEVSILSHCHEGIQIEPHHTQMTLRGGVLPSTSAIPVFVQQLQFVPDLPDGEYRCNYTATVLTAPVWTDIGKVASWSASVKVRSSRFVEECNAERRPRLAQNQRNNTEPLVALPNGAGAVFTTGRVNVSVDIINGTELAVAAPALNVGTFPGELDTTIRCDGAGLAIRGTQLPREPLDAGEGDLFLVTLIHTPPSAPQPLLGNSTLNPPPPVSSQYNCELIVNLTSLDGCPYGDSVVERIVIDFAKIMNFTMTDTTPPHRPIGGNESIAVPATPSINPARTGSDDHETPPKSPLDQVFGPRPVGEQIIILLSSVVGLVVGIGLAAWAIIRYRQVRHRNPVERRKSFHQIGPPASSPADTTVVDRGEVAVVEMGSHNTVDPAAYESFRSRSQLGAVHETDDMLDGWVLHAPGKDYRVLTDFAIMNGPRAIPLGSFETESPTCEITGRLSRPDTRPDATSGTKGMSSTFTIKLDKIEEVFWDEDTDSIWLRSPHAVYLLGEPATVYFDTFLQTLQILRAGNPLGAPT